MQKRLFQALLLAVTPFTLVSAQSAPESGRDIAERSQKVQFGYQTLTGWAYYGEQFLEYLFGRRVVLPYRWIYCSLIPLGAMLAPEVVWAWGDLMNALQIFPNVIGLVGMSAIAAKFGRSPREPFSTSIV